MEGSKKRLEVGIGKIKVEELNFGAESEQKIQVSTRKSGSCWIIEFFHKSSTVLDEKLAQTCDDKQAEWTERVTKRAIGVRVASEKEAEERGLTKFDIMKSLMIVKLGGIGISLVDFNPRELCYLSVEGIVLLNESNLYKDGHREKTFTKIQSSIRNLQIDDCLSSAVPIVFGTKKPFRNIERQFRQSHGEERMEAE